jgi:hypothetical protein
VGGPPVTQLKSLKALKSGTLGVCADTKKQESTDFPEILELL